MSCVDSAEDICARRCDGYGRLRGSPGHAIGASCHRHQLQPPREQRERLCRKVVFLRPNVKALCQHQWLARPNFLFSVICDRTSIPWVVRPIFDHTD